MRYTGKGFIAGVPARDLTDEEAERFGRERLLNSGLYEDDGCKRCKGYGLYTNGHPISEDAMFGDFRGIDKINRWKPCPECGSVLRDDQGEPEETIDDD